MYNRQEVYEAILRGKPLDNKQIWKQQTIWYSPAGDPRYVPLTDELKEMLGRYNQRKAA